MLCGYPILSSPIISYCMLPLHLTHPPTTTRYDSLDIIYSQLPPITAMGAKQTKKQQLTPPSDIKINHDKFQRFLYHEQTDLLEITLEMQNQKDLKQWNHSLKRLASFEDKENLLLPNKHDFQSKGFCGTAGTVKIFYENYPYLFEEEIENRIEMDKHFEDEELWYLLYSLVSSAADFNKINSKIGDIRPYNIFINEEGQIKIANLYSWPYERTNFEKTTFEKTLTYLSPEEIRLVTKGVQENITNKVISESFSIGLTLLQSGLLFNAKELYLINNFNYTMDLEKLKNKLRQWSNLEFTIETEVNRRYSPLLRNIVIGMCNPDERERLTSLQVEEVLRPHQNEILNLREFDQRNTVLPGNVELVPAQHISSIQVAEVRQSPVRQVVGVQQLELGQVQPFQAVQQVQQVQYQPQQMQFQGQQVQFQAPQPIRQIQQVQQIPQGQPPLIIPQQTVIMSQPLEPKMNSQPLVFQQQQFTRPVSAQSNSIRFNTGETVYVPQNEPNRVVMNPFEKTELRTQSIPIGTYEQQFHKYSTFNPSGPVPNGQIMMPSMQTAPAINPISTVSTSNALNFNGVASSRPWELPPSNVTSNNITATSQYTRPYSSIQGSTQVTTSMAGGNEGSSDFLKKIDEQLQASRHHFPS